MELFAKILLLGVLATLLWQDVKERQVWWFLLPLFALAGTYLFFVNTSFEQYTMAVLLNLGIILVILGSIYLYVKWKLRKEFLSEAFGLGDLLFFVAFAISLPTVSFLHFFVSALLFSLLIHLLIRIVFRRNHTTIPLAGTMSLFLIIVYSVHWLGYFETLYLF